MCTYSSLKVGKKWQRICFLSSQHRFLSAVGERENYKRSMCSSVRMASQKNISLKHTICSWFFQEHFHYWWHPPPAFMYCVFFLHVLSPCGRGKLPTYMFFAPKPKSRNSRESVFISTWHDPVLSCHGTLRRTSPLKCHHMDNPLIGWLSYHFHSLLNHILNLPQYHVNKKTVFTLQRLQ